MDGEKITIDLMLYCRALISLYDATCLLEAISSRTRDDWMSFLQSNASNQLQDLTDDEKQELTVFLAEVSNHE
ncbi:hypothetical protein [Nostoc sp.]|uniref:hypothetical protein n=1 Tax=Nostoc sp. TaxID=1180 RepID=UPI002FF664C0